MKVAVLIKLQSPLKKKTKILRTSSKMAMSKTKLAIIIVVIILLIIVGAVLIWYFVTHPGQSTKTGATDTQQGGKNPKPHETEGSGSDHTDSSFAGSGVNFTDAAEGTSQVPWFNESSGSGFRPTDAFEKDQEPWLSMRLPKTLVPYYYKVELKPVLTPDANGLYWFNGSSQVSFTAMESTSSIIIHSKTLSYLSMEIASLPDKKTHPIKDRWIYVPNEYLIIDLMEPLMASINYSFKAEYFGPLESSNTGIYRTEYVNASGFTVSVVGSQMETTFARKVFPCFDEPSFKAAFEIGLWHDKSKFALSNMNLAFLEEKADGWKLSRFHITPRMSTYLVAIVVCDFHLFEESPTNTYSKTKTRVFARPQQIQSGNAMYANDISAKLLDYFTEFFGVQYPLPKSDQIAIPGYNFATAMENWGLVIYKETTLLYNESRNTVFNKQKVASVVAHELSHQWFGNIISPFWWDEIWLNKGFATYVLYLGVSEVEPTWGMEDQFVVNELHRAMSVDALVNSRPIVARNVNTNNEIIALFDAIAYAKGACIIRMIRAFAGEDAFKLGLKNYLNENKYGSVTHPQLFTYWEEAIGQTEGGSNPPVGFMNAMSTWVLQMGYPVVNVKRHYTDSNKVIVSQERFLLNDDIDLSSSDVPFDYTWVVPFWYATQGEMKKNLTWLLPGLSSIIEVQKDDYIIGNSEVFGYYRVNYDAENWRRITDQLLKYPEAVDAKTRGQLLDDAFNLARAGRLPYDIALNLSKLIMVDFNYITWKSAFDAFSYIDKMLAKSNFCKYFSDYILNLVTPSYNHFGWDIQNDHLQIQQQNLVNTLACSFGNRNCKSVVRGIFHQSFAGHNANQKTKNYKPVVYCQALANGGEKKWNLVWEAYKGEEDSHEKSTLMESLTCTKDPLLIQRLLNFTRTGNYVRIHEGPSILINLCNNNCARDLVWNFLKREWEFVLKSYGFAVFDFRKLILSCASYFSTPEELKDLEMFVSDNAGNMGFGSKTFQQAIELVRANVQWKKHYENLLLSWFKNAEF